MKTKEISTLGIKFGLIWTLANVVGVSVGYLSVYGYSYMQQHAGPMIANVAMGIGIGAGIGIAQGVVLFKRVSVGWTLATAMGFAVGLALVEFMTDKLSWVATGLSVGLFVGAAQGIVLGLRSTFARWVITNMIGYALGYALGYGIPTLLSLYPCQRPLGVPMIGVGIGLVSWFALRSVASIVSTAEQ